MALYSDKVMDHFKNPRNVGEIPDADGVGEVGNAKCGDIMKMYLKIKDNIIEDVKFETFGCGSAIASSSMATEMIKGKTDRGSARRVRTRRSWKRSTVCPRTSCTAACWPRRPSRPPSRTITTRTTSPTTTPGSPTAKTAAAAIWCELVKKVFLTSSQTRPTSLGSRLKGLRLAAAHSLTLARLRAEKYFCRRTRRRQKCFVLYLRLRAQTLRGFFDRLRRRRKSSFGVFYGLGDFFV